MTFAEFYEERNGHRPPRWMIDLAAAILRNQAFAFHLVPSRRSDDVLCDVE